MGVPLERIMRFRNHVSTTVILRHYLDPLVSELLAVRVLFSRFTGRFAPTGTRPASPVATVFGIPTASPILP